MYRFYDVDEKGHYKKHQFDKEEVIWGFWTSFILGFLIPVIIMIVCA